LANGVRDFPEKEGRRKACRAFAGTEARYGAVLTKRRRNGRAHMEEEESLGRRAVHPEMEAPMFTGVGLPRAAKWYDASPNPPTSVSRKVGGPHAGGGNLVCISVFI